MQPLSNNTFPILDLPCLPCLYHTCALSSFLHACRLPCLTTAYHHHAALFPPPSPPLHHRLPPSTATSTAYRLLPPPPHACQHHLPALAAATATRILLRMPAGLPAALPFCHMITTSAISWPLPTCGHARRQFFCRTFLLFTVTLRYSPLVDGRTVDHNATHMTLVTTDASHHGALPVALRHAALPLPATAMPFRLPPAYRHLRTCALHLPCPTLHRHLPPAPQYQRHSPGRLLSLAVLLFRTPAVLPPLPPACLQFLP